ncbi:hypothetical protein NA56DRAFT_703041 [Hyaloscypha hepaticicola]|uniref:Uncharacterized protein n=1 Tax=Hyaloscypha hepaticicola TaxID=2082293 RepID=A0A2J6Q737_9HELO|nr:hypothetical protein NA56DRAFT_703041 [Hyaloscypha hepaticicola]
MCTAFQNHCPSCCTNNGGVYPRRCPDLHPIDEQNPKIALETCDRCKRKEQKYSWWKDKWASLLRLFWIKASAYQVEEEQPDHPTILVTQYCLRRENELLAAPDVASWRGSGELKWYCVGQQAGRSGVDGRRWNTPQEATANWCQRLERTITPSSSITPRMLRILYPISCLQKPNPN